MRSAPNTITLNGAYGEGGAALFRTAISMSALTQIPVRVHGVRGATRKPGLTAEDLTFLTALETSCAASVEGGELGSNAVTFQPSRFPRALNVRLDVQAFEKGHQPGNALVLGQSLMPVLARTGAYSRLLIQGETYNPNTLTFDVFNTVTLGTYRRQGIYGYVRQELAGFGYASQGDINLEIEPSLPNPIKWEKRGKLISARLDLVYSDIQPSVAQRGVSIARGLAEEDRLSLEIEEREVNSKTPGIFASLCAEFENGFGAATSMGAKNIRVEQMIRQLFDSFREWNVSNATTDPFLADQILIPSVIAGGETYYSTSKVTSRLTTMAWVIKQFVPIHITILGLEGEPGTIKISV
ncbi:MAG: hypothetical protein JST40_09715 [Armatimonadetes bacterium]|nr:hypothetical protein [Armatimonadota bacterium]